MARWLIAFCRASKWYIREDEPLAQELTPWLEPGELTQLVSQPQGRHCHRHSSYAPMTGLINRERKMASHNATGFSRGSSSCPTSSWAALADA